MRGWKLRTEFFEPWVKENAPHLDMNYDTYECVYRNSVTEVVWCAYRAGYSIEEDS